jgi:hypothetical protein
MRAPGSSLAAAALSEAERGVALASQLPKGIKGREDLPMLRRFLARALTAMVDGPAEETSHEAAKILRSGHQVERASATSVSPATGAVSHFPAPVPLSGVHESQVPIPAHDESGEAGQRRLPATFDEACAAAETFSDPELELELDPIIFNVGRQDDFGRCIDDELEACGCGWANLADASHHEHRPRAAALA